MPPFSKSFQIMLNKICKIEFIFIFVILVLVTYIYFNCDKNIVRLIMGNSEAQKQLQLYMQEPWFTEIKSGRKTVEGRVGREGSKNSWIGKRMLIIGPKSSVTVRVKAIRYYDNLQKYIETEGWEKIAPQTGSNEKAFETYMAIKMKGENRVFSPERIANMGGINAMEISLEN